MRSRTASHTVFRSTSAVITTLIVDNLNHRRYNGDKEGKMKTKTPKVETNETVDQFWSERLEALESRNPIDEESKCSASIMLTAKRPFTECTGKL